MGAGAVFTQRDLAAHECMLLDCGRNTLFLWHGPDTTPAARGLGTAIATNYAATMPGPQFYAAIPPSYALPGRLADRDEAAAEAADRIAAIPKSFGAVEVSDIAAARW
jgi:hypothetical protein